MDSYALSAHPGAVVTPFRSFTSTTASASLSSSTSLASAPGLSKRPILFDEGWRHVYHDGIAKLQLILSSSFTSGTSAFSNNEYVALYTTIYEMCIQKPPHCYTPELYDHYDQCIAEYLTTHVTPVLLSPQCTGELLLKETVRRWADHKVMKKWLFDFFRYLDRFYVKRHGKKGLNDVALQRFKGLVFDQVKGRVSKAIIEQMERDRNGEVIDRQMLHEVVHLYIDIGQSSASTTSSTSSTSSTTLAPRPSHHSSSSSSSASTSTSSSSPLPSSLKVYQQDLERGVLKSTAEFYARESAVWLASDSCPEYLRKVEERLKEEKRRIVDYLHPSSEAALLSCLYDTLLISHQSQILEKEMTGVKAMLEAHNEGDLSRVFSLYSHVPSSLLPIARIVQQHIQDVGLALIDKVNASSSSEGAGPVSYIEELMALHEKYFELIRLSFQSHSSMQKALREAMEVIVNRNTDAASTAELLSTYADDVLKKGGLKLTEKQVQSVLENLVRLFAYLVDKDLFSEFYRKQLATRLLMQRSASTDAEKQMIGKLKLRCGAQFTSKLEGMVNDMRSASDHVVEFKHFLTQRRLHLDGIDFTVQTLSTGFWPSYPMDDIKLPPQLSSCIEAFRVYYDSKTNNRRLRWIHDLGTVTLAASFPKRKVDLLLSTVQATILLLFNSHDSLTITQLIALTGLDADVLKLQLKVLVNGKYKLLVKQPAEAYHPSHTIKPNVSFTQPMRSIRIPSALRRVGGKDREGVIASVSEDRKHAMEANIVRVMKARKTLLHQQLMAEVSAQLMAFFQPDPKEIKKRIEDLIARDYIERDKEHNNLYHYLA